MPTPSEQSPVGGMPYNLTVQAGQTVLLYSGTKIILKVTVTKPVRYFTAHNSIVGTLAQVDARASQLSLTF